MEKRCSSPGRSVTMQSRRSVGSRFHLARSTRASPGDDLLGEIRSVVSDEPEQCGTSRVLPGHAEEGQQGHVGDPAPVHDATVHRHAGDCDPGVVRAVARGPDHNSDVEAAAVGELCSVALSVWRGVIGTASLNLADVIVAPTKSASVKLAPVKSAPLITASRKVTPVRSEFTKSGAINCFPAKLSRGGDCMS